MFWEASAILEEEAAGSSKMLFLCTPYSITSQKIASDPKIQHT
jgi:hypothetical protein